MLEGLMKLNGQKQKIDGIEGPVRIGARSLAWSLNGGILSMRACATDGEHCFMANGSVIYLIRPDEGLRGVRLERETYGVGDLPKEVGEVFKSILGHFPDAEIRRNDDSCWILRAKGFRIMAKEMEYPNPGMTNGDLKEHEEMVEKSFQKLCRLGLWIPS